LIDWELVLTIATGIVIGISAYKTGDILGSLIAKKIISEVRFFIFFFKYKRQDKNFSWKDLKYYR
jgi:hypothetical protein